ncbi:hypothetical protein NCPPB3778_68 [Rathayibacter phage NCPPB3778]|nr:hypothetical protein NCPPB3778_68 [Rathayibacter phage NCPPB3778]
MTYVFDEMLTELDAKTDKARTAASKSVAALKRGGPYIDPASEAELAGEVLAIYGRAYLFFEDMKYLLQVADQVAARKQPIKKLDMTHLPV